MNIAFRTDASHEIGTGHFMRCLTLADALKQTGARIRFVSRGLPIHLRDMLSAKGIEFSSLDNEKTGQKIGDLPHSSWLGASQVQDANATIQALSDISWDWLVVDHYALDSCWEKVLRATAKQIMVIDDIADRQHDCDVLLDQNYYADMQIRYLDKVPSHCKLLLGPSFALLRDEFISLREKVFVRSGSVKRILVFFGGVDVDNFTTLALRALAELDRTFHLDVVVGAQHPYIESIQEVCVKHGYYLHIQSNKMAKLMSEADFSIGAGGSASWERCCLGLPCLIVALAKNQIDIAKNLANLGACVYMGFSDEILISDIKNSLTDLLNNHAEIERISKNAFSLVDGQGVYRVSKELGF